MSELRGKIKDILDQYAREEMGNRVTQFSVIGLKAVVLDEIDKGCEKVDEECQTSKS